MIDLYENEKRLWHLGYENIAGCDEAGRGPLFGPVVIASVILPHNFVLEGLNDSKKLTEKKREEYYPVIMQKALAVSVSIVEADEIDKKHPEYEFKKHKGYPTKKHLELIEMYGIIDGYRRTYGPVKKYIEEHKINKEA